MSYASLYRHTRSRSTNIPNDLTQSNKNQCIQNVQTGRCVSPKLPNPPSFLHHGQLQFFIMDAPTDDNLNTYIYELNQKSVHCIVRTCEPTYSSEQLNKYCMKIRDLPFPDGHPPSDDVVSQWLELVTLENHHQHRPIAVHCVAGLGRAPLLVAIALIEIGGIEPNKAIKLIRSKRRGAINQKQYEYLKNYQRKAKNNCCTVL